jgi:hypothetical protein
MLPVMMIMAFSILYRTHGNLKGDSSARLQNHNLEIGSCAIDTSFGRKLFYNFGSSMCYVAMLYALLNASRN